MKLSYLPTGSHLNGQFLN